MRQNKNVYAGDEEAWNQGRSAASRGILPGIFLAAMLKQGWW